MPGSSCSSAEVLDDVRDASGSDDAAATDALWSVGLDPSVFGSRQVDQLSGGEQRRVAIAGMLARQTSVLVLDEPFAGLDKAGSLQLVQVLAHLRAEWGITLIIVSHDNALLGGIADRFIRLEAGRVVSDSDSAPPPPAVSTASVKTRRPASDLSLLRLIPGSSPLHRLWAGTKLLAVGVLSLAASAQANVADPPHAGRGRSRRPDRRSHPDGSAPPSTALVPLRARSRGRPERSLQRSAAGASGLIATQPRPITSSGSPDDDPDSAGAQRHAHRVDDAARRDPGRLDRVGTSAAPVGLPIEEWVNATALAIRSLPSLIDESRTLIAARRLRRRANRGSWRDGRQAMDELGLLAITAITVALRRAPRLE